MRDGLSVIAGVMGDGNVDTDGTDLVYRLTNHSHIPMVDCNTISHLFIYYKITLRRDCAIFPKYGVFKALTKTKHKTFT